MSHFTVMVVLPGPDYSRGALDAALAPFHEFECTGMDNQYIQDIDETDEFREGFKTAKMYGIVVRPDGTKVWPYGPDGNYNSEFERYYDRTERELNLPEGYSQINTELRKDWESFAEYCSGYCGRTIVPYGEKPDLEDEHKYGYTVVDQDGQVVQVINRTNPNAKWDWYQVGGRWQGRYPRKPGATGVAMMGDRSWTNKDQSPNGRYDIIRVGDIDLDLLEKEGCERAFKEWKILEKYVSQEDIKAMRGTMTWSQAVDAYKELHGEFDRDGVTELQLASNDIYRRNKENLEVAHKEIDKWAWGCEIEAFSQFDKEAFIAKKIYNEIGSYAILKDGEWVSKGEMGWFGVSTDENEDWETKCVDLIRNLHPNSVIVNVDCHI